MSIGDRSCHKVFGEGKAACGLDCCDEPGLGLGDIGGVESPWARPSQSQLETTCWELPEEWKGLFTVKVDMHLASRRQRTAVEGF